MTVRLGQLDMESCPKYAEWQLREYLKDAGVGQRFLGCSFETYVPATPSQSVALKMAQQYAESLPCDKSLLIIGPCGVGKTHLAVAIAREALKVNIGDVVIRQVPEVLGEIRAAISRGDENAHIALERYANANLLILDDLGAEKITEWVREQLFLLVDARYQEMLPTVLTSNNSLEEIEQLLGPRIASRLAGMCQGVVIDGPDHRIATA
ncbi:MAG: ATP-binding protein [Firmicutes bacterium]|nr:ATP-binding protein [Bacillota bacterium]